MTARGVERLSPGQHLRREGACIQNVNYCPQELVFRNFLEKDVPLLFSQRLGVCKRPAKVIFTFPSPDFLMSAYAADSRKLVSHHHLNGRAPDCRCTGMQPSK